MSAWQVAFLTGRSMNSWWEALTTDRQIFWAIAIGASLLQVLLLLGSFLGGHDFDSGADADVDAGSHGDGGAKFLSVRAVVAFLVGFGWAGVVALDNKLSLGLALVWAVVAGVLMMGMVFGLMRGMLSLRDDGTLDYTNAVGLHGQVYVTVPALRRGQGQVEVKLQGRLITAQAMTAEVVELPPQSMVKIVGVEAGNVLVVSRV